MKKQFFVILLTALPFLGFSQKTGVHSYSIDITKVINDRVKVSVDASAVGLGDATDGQYAFHFPATIPGTYATLDFGRFIHDFLAFDEKSNLLKVKKKGNSYYIYGKPHRIEYWAEDTFDAKIRKNKVFEPAGTNNQERRNFLLNNAGYFGFFEGMEELPVTLEVVKSPTLYGISAMESYTYGNTQVFNARNYHHFLDCPVMVSKPDTTSFRLGGARVTISVFTENGRELSDEIYGAVKTSMGAIEEFLEGELPVKDYAFIFYIKDYTEFEGLFNGSEFSLKMVLKAIRQLSGKGFGALEHGNSSVYFLPDFGGNSVLDDMADVCIHEFFHILTPLGLHSEEIGHFDYIDPKMSEHLWLYEGVTEYFAGISQVKGGVISKDQYVRSLLREKLVTSAKFPNDKMSFTEMSANVLDKPYKKQYPQVYQRGAVIGALLDIRIMELTQGKMTLKDVILELRERYGAEKSFKDEEIIAEFVALVHPDLQSFFDRYVTGNQDLPVKEYLSKVGIHYDRSYVGPLVVDPISDNDVKAKRVRGTNAVVIKKVGKKEFLGLQEGDRVERSKELTQNPYGGVTEGTVVPIEIVRDGTTIEIPYTVRYEKGAKGHFIRFAREPNARELQLQELWLGNGPIH